MKNWFGGKKEGVITSVGHPDAQDTRELPEPDFNGLKGALSLSYSKLFRVEKLDKQNRRLGSTSIPTSRKVYCFNPRDVDVRNAR